MNRLLQKWTLCFLLLLGTSIFAHAQQIKFADCDRPLTKREYRELIEMPERYSPGGAGLLTYFCSPIGYLYVGEPLRGLAVFGGEMTALTVAIVGFSNSWRYAHEDDDYGFSGSNRQKQERAKTVFLSGLAAYWGLKIWSLFDVSHVARVKNLAYQEQNKLSFSLTPSLMPTHQNSHELSVGLTLRIDL